ncbi:MAG TPA: hypothetical protein VF591_03190 [Pyrinomonadaceae bacterium]|jgi:hypothetical protein
MSECKAYRREIDEAADGRPVSASARAHAALCRACGDGLRERERLRALVGGLGKVEAPADFEFRLRARMAASKIDGGHGRFSGARWLYGFAPVAVAACFVVVSATLYFRQAARTSPAAAPAVAAAPPRNIEPARVPSDGKEQTGTVEPAAAGGQIVQERRAEVASSKAHNPAHKVNVRAERVREVASVGGRRADVAPRTLEHSVTGAQVIHLPVKTSAETLRVILRDESGAERVVPMRSVSFGSQDFLSRGASGRPPVAVEVGGVW